MLRGNLLVLGSFAASFPALAAFPIAAPPCCSSSPPFLAILGTFDTLRCMQRRWNFYHGGVILLLFMDMLAVCLILFFLLFPYLF